MLVVETSATGAEMLFLIDLRFESLTFRCECFLVRVRCIDMAAK